MQPRTRLHFYQYHPGITGTLGGSRHTRHTGTYHYYIGRYHAEFQITSVMNECLPQGRRALKLLRITPVYIRNYNHSR